MDIFAGGQIDAPGGGLAYPVPGVPGRVAAILIKEDQHVKQGQIILQLDNEAERKKLEAAEAELAAAKYKLEGSNSAVTIHKTKLNEAELQVKTAKSALVQIEIAITELEKNLQLAKSAQSELRIKQQQKKDAQNHVEAAEKSLALLGAIDPRLVLKENEENLKKAEKNVEAAKAEIEKFFVKAPFDGRVISLNIRPGEQFGAIAYGAPPPIVFCPDGDLVARAQVDQENAWKVKPGMKVTLKDKSPSRHHEWTGVVERVSPWLQKQRGNAFELDQMNDTRTRECIIRITPDPDNPLIIGQQMRVRIHVDSK
jgi:membrane fusion protein (multidrug efflux system)